jgi:hypothetical protein
MIAQDTLASERMRVRFAATITVLPALVAGLLLLLTLPAQAAAAKPCWERVIDDWLASPNGTITGTYKPSCLLRALRYGEGREDLRDYSNITDAIGAALQVSLRNVRTPDSNTDRTIQGVPQSPYRQAIRKLGGDSADSVPIPLLVLAGLGSLLLLSAGGLATTKWIKTARSGRHRPPTAKP